MTESLANLDSAKRASALPPARVSLPEAANGAWLNALRPATESAPPVGLALAANRFAAPALVSLASPSWAAAVCEMFEARALFWAGARLALATLLPSRLSPPSALPVPAPKG
jgi:hypothetical protein